MIVVPFLIRTLIVLIASLLGFITSCFAASPLGMNLHWVKEWSEEQPFVDIFRTSRVWFSGTETVFQDNRTLNLDANGWVASLEPGQYARTTALQFTHPYIAGNYVVLYDGDGTMTFGRAAVVQSSPGRQVITLDASTGGLVLAITSTSTRNPIRNIRVIIPGGICQGDPYHYAASASACPRPGDYRGFEANPSIIFYPPFLQSLRNYRLIRFMEWGRTNNSTLATWNSRPKLTDAQWTSDKGMPIEMMVTLANTLGVDAWFNIPHLADDNYVQQYALLVKQTLSPNLKAYVEYSNEVWNAVYTQTAYAQQQGLAQGLSTSPAMAMLYFYSKRSLEVFSIWMNELGASRLKRIISTQALSGASYAKIILDYQNAKASTDALAIAPYFGPRLVTQAEQDRIRAMTLDEFFVELDTVVIPETITRIQDHVTAATERGLPLVAYEGGQGLVAFNALSNDATINSLFDAANRDPRMGALYKKYLDAWKAAGATMMTHYANCYGFNKYGRWGALEYLEQPRSSAPKYDALQTFIEQNPAWW